MSTTLPMGIEEEVDGVDGMDSRKMGTRALIICPIETWTDFGGRSAPGPGSCPERALSTSRL